LVKNPGKIQIDNVNGRIDQKGKDGSRLSAFLDSYAIVEMAKDNPRYDEIERESVSTSKFNLLESYYVLTQAGQEGLGEVVLRELGPVSVDIPLGLIPRIARFRLGEKGATGTVSWISSQGPWSSKGSVAFGSSGSGAIVCHSRHTTEGCGQGASLREISSRQSLPIQTDDRLPFFGGLYG
jgi:hypothetical protein